MFPVLALLSACNREPEAVATIEKYRPAVEVRLASIKQIGQKLYTTPPLSSDGAVLDNGPLQLGTGIDAPLPTDNAILETAPRLSDDLSADPGDGVGTRDLWWCAKLIGDKYYAERSSPSNAGAVDDPVIVAVDPAVIGPGATVAVGLILSPAQDVD